MTGRIVALSGGVGGAKLALGLARVLPAEVLTVVANTGDDFEHLGLHVSPDIDTLLYTLAGINNPETGWGRAQESWAFMEVLEELGAETWFKLGDKDVALHVIRTARLAAGRTLSEVTAELARALSVEIAVVPMTDDPVRTRVRTPDGWLDFQDYFVRHQCQPEVLELAYQGSGSALPAAPFAAAIASPDLEAIVIGPSNPYLSIDPILSLPGVRDGLAASKAPVVAVSPIVAGSALKGPTAKIMAELGVAATAASIAHHYRGVIDGFVLDDRDSPLATSIRAAGLAVTVANTVMQTLEDRTQLAMTVLDFARHLDGRVAGGPHVGAGSR